jgi:hypothetical protein
VEALINLVVETRAPRDPSEAKPCRRGAAASWCLPFVELAIFVFFVNFVAESAYQRPPNSQHPTSNGQPWELEVGHWEFVRRSPTG